MADPRSKSGGDAPWRVELHSWTSSTPVLDLEGDEATCRARFEALVAADQPGGVYVVDPRGTHVMTTWGPRRLGDGG